MVPGGRPGTQSDLLIPSRIGTKRDRLRERSGLIGDEGVAFFSFSFGANGVVEAFSAIDGIGTGSASSVVEDGGLHAPVEPHDSGRRQE